MLLRQQSYDIKNQLVAKIPPTRGGFNAKKDSIMGAYNRFFLEAMEATDARAGSLWHKTAGVATLRAPIIGPFSA